MTRRELTRREGVVVFCSIGTCFPQSLVFWLKQHLAYVSSLKKTRTHTGVYKGLGLHTNPAALRKKDFVQELGNSKDTIVRDFW